MRSLDTNILVRFVTQDDEAQLATAVSVLAEPCWIGVTVMLETWWVLTRLARFTASEAHEAISVITAMANVTVQHSDAVLWSASKASAGADFADMLHLALSGSADCFATFDRGIAAHAEGAPVPVETV